MGLWLGLAVMGNKMEGSSYQAYRSLRNGYAKSYASEMEERLVILKDKKVHEAYLKEIENRTELIYFGDIYRDSQCYENRAVAVYYGKDKVYLAE